jgi:hypothetical protein
MIDLTRPHHQHAKSYWWVPDTALGRSAAFVFAVAVVFSVAAPLVTLTVQQLLDPGQDTAWFFLMWGLTLVALLVATASALVAAVALVRDHALLLIAPVVIALGAASAIAPLNGVLN